MATNLTIDDTAATLIYGPGWGIQSPSDSTIGNYFQSTYHASNTVGAAVNLTFTGSAIYLYGSKGPTHSKFSVRYDSTVVTNLSAAAPDPEYLQLLFSTKFPGPPNGTHLVILTNTGGSDGGHSWLDLDYVTVTSSDGGSAASVASGFSSTISPLSLPSTSIPSPSSPQPTTPSASAISSSSSGDSPSGPTLILAIVFGILLFFLLIAVTIYLLRRRHRRKLHQRSGSNGSSYNSSFSNTTRPLSAGSAFLSPQQDLTATTVPPLSQQQHHNMMIAVSPLPSHSGHSRAYSQSNTDGRSGGSGSASGGSGSSSGKMRQGSHPHSPTLSSPSSSTPLVRPWSPLKTLFGPSARPPGADSMKSTFLKV